MDFHDVGAVAGQVAFARSAFLTSLPFAKNLLNRTIF